GAQVNQQGLSYCLQVGSVDVRPAQRRYLDHVVPVHQKVHQLSQTLHESGTSTCRTVLQ
uniref:Uncharacterized protein n=1 Tax=Amphimedon queenslandica TaxID=400682 RepID=A0A1X7UDK6_AMPQE